MRSLTYIKKEISTTRLVGSIVEVYEEVSAIKMNEIRDEIIRSRDFLERLADLSSAVGSDLASVAQEGQKDAAVYISSAKSSYGDLPEKVFMSFLQFVQTNQEVVPVIMGDVGKILASKHKSDLKYLYFEMDDTKNLADTLPLISNSLLTYKKVTVFYGKFRNIVSQDPTMGNLATEALKNVGKKQEERFKSKLKFIYEPSIEALSKKFANEIKTSVLEGMIMENKLAKTASRLMHLDQAYENIRTSLKKLDFEKTRQAKRIEDKKQQERVKRLWI